MGEIIPLPEPVRIDPDEPDVHPARVEPPIPSHVSALGEGLMGASRAMADLGARMRYGSPSVETWRRACEDQQAAANRRRARPVETHWWAYLRAAVTLALMAAGIALGLLLVVGLIVRTFS